MPTRIGPHGRRITGYLASHVLGVRLAQISTAPTVIDTVTVAAGDALRLEGLQLSTFDTAAARCDAAASAVADARSRAERLVERCRAQQVGTAEITARVTVTFQIVD